MIQNNYKSIIIYGEVDCMGDKRSNLFQLLKAERQRSLMR